MANIKIPSKLIFEQMATGQMISMRIYNSRLKKF